MKFRTMVTAIGLTAGMALAAPQAQAGADEYLGEIFMTGANFCPRGTMKADGQLLPISEYQALFSLMGTIYGGDGRTTFALPDLRGRVAVNSGKGPGLQDRKIGQRGGVEAQTLTQAQLPSHSHALNGSSESPDSANPTGKTFGSFSDDELYASDAAAGTAAMSSKAVGNTGGGQSVSVLDPYLSINFCVVTQGTYPSRS